MRPALVIAICVFPVLAAAKDDRTRKAEALVRSAEVLAEEGGFDEAIGLYERAYALDPDPVLLYNIARLHDRKGDLVRAREGYERYLAVETDPEGRAAGQARLEAVLDRIPGRLKVQVEPPLATVMLDGTPVEGRDVEVRRGVHRIEARLDGYVPVSREVVVRAGEEVEVRLALEPGPGTISLQCECPGALVTVDGVERGTVPLQGPLAVPPGKHQLVVVSEETGRVVRDLLLSPGEELTVNVPVRQVQARPAVRHGPRWTAGWALFATGVAALAGGGTLTYLAYQDRSGVDGAGRYKDGTVYGISRSEALDLEAAWKRKGDASIGLYTFGGLAVITAVVLLALPEKARDPGVTATGGLSR